MAYGRKEYIHMAEALLRSYRRFSPDRPFAIITNEENRDRASKSFDSVIILNSSYGSGVVQKLALDIYTCFSETIFVDSDCLFYKDPEILWQSYANKPFCIRGWRHVTGNTEYETKRPYEFVKDIPFFLRQLSIKQLPHINSGVIYFDDSSKAHSVFQLARNIYQKREGMGFVSFKGAPINDEPALAAAMEKLNIEMYEWDPVNGMETAIGMNNYYAINVLSGNSRFLKNGQERSSVLLHFNVADWQRRIYAREQYRLFLENSAFGELRSNVRSLTHCTYPTMKKMLQKTRQLLSR